jgi:hypothetical protein
MRYKSLFRVLVLSFALFMAFTPMKASAAVLKKGSSGSEVRQVQTTLRSMGYFTYPKITGYFGSNTETAVKRFQKAKGITADGKIGSITRKILFPKTESLSIPKTSALKVSDPNKAGTYDWFKKVQYIWKRGMDAVVTDVDTGRSFHVRRTFGTNHADVEPLTKVDANIIKEIWGGWKWDRHAVIVQVAGYTIAGSMSAMPHAGVDSAPAEAVVSGRSGDYGRGQNLDAVKNNGVSGVMDLHFLNSRTHNTNTVKQAHQIMVRKAADYLKNLRYL